MAGDAAPLLTLNDGQSVRGKMEFRGWREGGGHSKDLEGVQFPLNHQHVAEFSRLKGEDGGGAVKTFNEIIQHFFF